MLNTKPIADFMEIYLNMVPNIYVPEMSLVREILQTLRNSLPADVENYYALMWSQVLMFDLVEKENVTDRLFDLMVCHITSPKDSALKSQFADCAWAFFSYITVCKTRRYILNF